MHKTDPTKTPSISTFITKLQTLLQNSRLTPIINWNSTGDALVIDCHNQQIDTLLGEYFNHTKMSSFIRQLNLYGFRKISQKGKQVKYQHPYFIKDTPNLHHLIKRKKNSHLLKIHTNPLTCQPDQLHVDRTRISIEKLDDILLRVKKQNQRLSKQICRIKNHCGVFRKIRNSEFYRQLQISSQLIVQTVQVVEEEKKLQQLNNDTIKSEKNITLPHQSNSLEEQKQLHSIERLEEQMNDYDIMSNSLSRNSDPIENENLELLSSQKIFVQQGIDEFFWKYDDEQIGESVQN